MEMESTTIQQSATFVDLSCDDYYFSLVCDEDGSVGDPITPVSDAKYAEELQFQEAILSSLMVTQSTHTSEPPLVILRVRKREVERGESSQMLWGGGEGGESSQMLWGGGEEKGESSQMLCEICAERKEGDEMFRLESCSHMFCTSCISKHVATKIQDSIHVVTCPGLNCRGFLEFDSCKPIVPSDVLSRWDEILCESIIQASEKFYCPYRDCSAMMQNDSDGTIKESECPFCHRLFCAQCYVPWHSGVECEEFQRLDQDERGKEDIMVRELAKQKSWKRCPYCRFYVEKTEGCLHMTCRCKHEFCYACGAKWTSTHGGCQ